MSDEITKLLKLVQQYREAQLTADKSKSRKDISYAQQLGRLVDTKLKGLLKQNTEEVKALEMFTSG
jgi:hypothetical protein